MNNIVKYRGLKGMSQKELAEKLNISRTGLNLMENGKIWIIKKKTLLKICNILYVTPVMLLGEENLKYIPQNKEEVEYMKKVLQEIEDKL